MCLAIGKKRGINTAVSVKLWFFQRIEKTTRDLFFGNGGSEKDDLLRSLCCFAAAASLFSREIGSSPAMGKRKETDEEKKGECSASVLVFISVDLSCRSFLRLPGHLSTTRKKGLLVY